jgi:magnesium-transporting ATPase (P-type)
MYPLVFLSITLWAAAIHLILRKKKKRVSPKRIIEVILAYFLFINVGCTCLFAFVGHAFFPDNVAINIGWPTGSPFQFEVAIANLAFGVLGILCMWLRGNFWIAVALGSSIFSLGAATGHIREMIAKQNFAIYNVGPVLFVNDILVPLIILALVVAYKSTHK